ncbi:hypothetical protein [Rosistilla oblonga]|uniref:hypothetical protein n=1 Tax=Rosistilla oblonga TaxID=2527990 RepID=UPI003A97B658
MAVVPLAEGDATDRDTVLTVGAQGGAAVSRQRGQVVRQTHGLIYYKPEALPGRSGSPLLNESGTKVIGLVAWRKSDGHGLAMNAAAVRSFVRGEVANVETERPDDAIPALAISRALGSGHVARMPTMRNAKAFDTRQCAVRDFRYRKGKRSILQDSHDANTDGIRRWQARR